MARYLAYRGGNCVGRIAAIDDPAFREKWGHASGFFGFFECIDDGAAAQALLATAESQLRAWGITHALGPVNLTTHDEVGLLTHGYDSAPMILSPYNPPNYKELMKTSGYSPAREYHSYLWCRGDTPESAVRRAAGMANNLRRAGWRFRNPGPTTWQADLKTLWTLYNLSFEPVWGFTPISWEEFSDRAEQFRNFYDPRLVLIAELQDRPVGFALALPNINQALARLRSRLPGWRWLRFALSARRINQARLILLGVDREYRGRGIGAMLAQQLIDTAVRFGYSSAEISLVDADNSSMQKLITAFRIRLIKTFVLYGKSLRASPADADHPIAAQRP